MSEPSTRTLPFKARLPGLERKARILEEAREAFTTRGYEATSMGEIASAADVARPVLYHYFPSKQDLYRDVLDQYAQALDALVTDHVAAADTAGARLVAAADAYLAFAEENPGGWLMLTLDAEGNDRSDPDSAKRAERFLRASLRHFADQTPKTDDLDTQRHELAMGFVIAGINGAIRWWQRHPDVSRGEVLDTLTALLTHLGSVELRPDAAKAPPRSPTDSPSKTRSQQIM